VNSLRQCLEISLKPTSWKRTQSASTIGLRSRMTYLQHLVSFVHTAEHGSFFGAARILA
jgi:hypothetical protein